MLGGLRQGMKFNLPWDHSPGDVFVTTWTTKVKKLYVTDYSK